MAFIKISGIEGCFMNLKKTLGVERSMIARTAFPVRCAVILDAFPAEKKIYKTVEKIQKRKERIWREIS